eukprot:233577_1
MDLHAILLRLLYISVSVYSVLASDCSDNIDGGDWYLVRHTYNEWHPATDKLAGTDEYGIYDADALSQNAWSIPFDQYLASDGSTEFLFGNGDCSKWLITKNDQFTSTTSGATYLATIDSSSSFSTSYQATWFNRPEAQFDEDPWISVQNHATDLVYGEAQNEYHLSQINGGYLNVWIRNVNECLDKTDTCDDNAVCEDTTDSYDCTCKTGYSGDGHSCEDICMTITCDDNAVCAQDLVNLPGYTCTCDDGYSGDGATCCDDETYGFDTTTGTCTDINECTLGTDNCAFAATCTNSEGGFSCDCATGYDGDGVTCVSAYQVLEISAANCNDFFQLEELVLSTANIVGSCIINEEVEVEFDLQINTLPGSSYYSLFHIGNKDSDRMPGVWIRGGNNAWTVHNSININNWFPDSNNPDIDLTNPRPFVGVQHFYMRVTPTNYYLSIAGMEFTYSGNFDRSNYIGETHNIYFSDFTYPTVDGVVANVCIKSDGEVDECSQNTHECDDNATCEDTEDSYTCECNDGYEGSGKVCCVTDSGYVYDAAANACVNVDECTSDELNDCDDNASCTDTEGSYQCVCNDGYTGDGYASSTGCALTCDMDSQNFIWEELVQSATGKPYESTTLSIDGLTLTIEAELSYLGFSEADQDGYVYGTTYVIDFEDFDAHKSSIRDPGTCQNRVATDLTESAASWDTLWSYSESPGLSGHLGTANYLAYPPPGVWSVEMADIETACHVVYTASLTWAQLMDCTGSDGTPFVTPVDSEDALTLSGTVYINVVSPFSPKMDFGWYRVYQLLSQPFQIVVSKTTYVLGSVGINLLTMDVVAVYKEDQENTFRLIFLTESAEYLQLSRDAEDLTETGYLQAFLPDDTANLVTAMNFKTLKTAATDSDCLGNKDYICTQLWEITAENVQCSETTGEYTDFSGTYNIQFDAVCRTTGDYVEYCDQWLIDHGDEIVDETGKVFLSAGLEWTDTICDPEIFTVQFTAAMEFFQDDLYSLSASDYLYQVGESTVYAKVTTEYPDNALDVFETELLNVWICTFDPLDPPDALDPALEEGGCFATKADDSKFIEHVYDAGDGTALYDFAVDEDTSGVLESNEIQFQFDVPSTVARDTLYVHAQIEVSLAPDRRRMIVDSFMKKEANQMEHFVDRIGVIASPQHEPKPQNQPHDVNYEPKAPPQTPVQQPWAISLQTPWIIGIASVLGLLLTFNIVWMCYMKCVKRSGGRYAPIKAVDSEFDSASMAENDPLNVASE